MLHQTWTSNIRPLVIMYYNSYLMMVLMYVFFYHSPMKDNWSTFFLLKIILIKFKKNFVFNCGKRTTTNFLN